MDKKKTNELENFNTRWKIESDKIRKMPMNNFETRGIIKQFSAERKQLINILYGGLDNEKGELSEIMIDLDAAGLRIEATGSYLLVATKQSNSLWWEKRYQSFFSFFNKFFSSIRLLFK